MLSLARRASAFCRTLLFPALAPDSQPVLARAAGDGVKQARPRREKVSFLIPGQAPLVSIHVTQRSLSNLLDKSGAIGFEVADGAVSQELEDLPEGAAVHLVMPKVPSFATQVRNLQGAHDNTTRSWEFRMQAFLRTLASNECAGASVTALQTAPFKGVSDEDYVQLDAAIRAGKVLYVGEVKRVLGETSVVDLECKLLKIRAALTRGASPDLAAALQGVTDVKLLLGGEVVRAGMMVQRMVDLAAEARMSVVLPSGQGLGLMGPTPAPTVQL